MNHSVFLEKVRQPPEDMGRLDATAFWQSHDAYVVRAETVLNPPFFYPLYRWEDLYSFSPLPLLVRKGVLRVDRHALEDLSRPGNDVSRPNPFIDRDIERIGGPPELTRRIGDRSVFIAAIAEAMQADVAEVEAKNPGKTNVILCGGRDSLNLLLLDWTNPVVVYSARPNFPLVQRFAADNALKIEVRELKDDADPALLPREIAEAATLTNLENWKWAPHLRRIAEDHGGQAVFWKGQFADAFLTDYWRSYTSDRARAAIFAKKAYRKLAPSLPGAVRGVLDPPTLAQFRTTIWQRGAVGQGAHMGFLRSITDCLWVSAYHGPRTAAVWLAGDYPRLTDTDLRPKIGVALHGGDVLYPSENPAPPISRARAGLRTIEAFETALSEFGVTRATT